MFKHDNLENHLRDIAHSYEAPYEPSDWADMQKRLQQAKLTQSSPSPLSKFARRTVVLVAIVLLAFSKASQISYEKNLLQTVRKNPKTEKSIKELSDIAQKALAKNNTSTPKTKYTALTNQQIQATQQANIQPEIIEQPTQNLPTNPDLPVSNEATATHEMIPSLGIVAIEPFMQKEFVDSTINIQTVPALQEEKDMKMTGYQHIDIYVSEGLQNNIAFKIGTEGLYNIFAIGYQFNGGGRLGIGYGFGKELRKKRNGSLNMEILCYYIKENNFRTDLNILAQTKFQLNRRLTRKITGFAGISLNALASNNIGEDLVTSAGIPNWAVLNASVGETKLKIWTGLNLGMSIRLQ